MTAWVSSAWGYLRASPRDTESGLAADIRGRHTGRISADPRMSV